MLSRKHFALIYMKLSKHYHREWDRDAEQAQYEGLQDRLGDDQLDDAYRHLLATSSSKDFMPRTEEFIHAANAAWASRCNAASGDKCSACDSQGYVNMVAVQAHYDLGEERASLMHWFPAHLIWDDTQLLGWSQPVGWSIWTTACVCDCEAGQRKIRSAERANADAKGDPRPVPKPHKHYTGETAQPGSYLAAQDLKNEIGLALTKRWGPAAGGLRFFDPYAPLDQAAPAPHMTTLDAVLAKRAKALAANGGIERTSYKPTNDDEVEW